MIMILIAWKCKITYFGKATNSYQIDSRTNVSALASKLVAINFKKNKKEELA